MGIYRHIDKTIPNWLKLLGLLVLPVALYFVPVDWLEARHPVCLYKNIFGRECFGCGITRAMLSALQFHFSAAWHYNKLVIVVLPLLIFVWGRTVKQLFAFVFGIKNVD